MGDEWAGREAAKQPTSAGGAPLWMKMMTARTCVSCIAPQPAILFSWQRYLNKVLDQFLGNRPAPQVR
jgi:hypothetical protein